MCTELEHVVEMSIVGNAPAPKWMREKIQGPSGIFPIGFGIVAPEQLRLRVVEDSLPWRPEGVRLFRLIPTWASDLRPYLVGCDHGRAVGLAGLPAFDTDVISWHHANQDTATWRRESTELVKLIDTNAGDQRTLGWAVREAPSGGAIVEIIALSPVTWSAGGIPDSIRYRLSYRPDRSLEQIDRVVLAGHWIEEGGADSLRVP